MKVLDQPLIISLKLDVVRLINCFKYIRMALSCRRGCFSSNFIGRRLSRHFARARKNERLNYWDGTLYLNFTEGIYLSLNVYICFSQRRIPLLISWSKGYRRRLIWNKRFMSHKWRSLRRFAVKGNLIRILFEISCGSTHNSLSQFKYLFQV